MEFHERIRGLREDKDLTQADMGKILNMTQRKVSRLETGESEPCLQDIKLLCSFFDFSADYILGYTDEQKPFPHK